VVVGGGFLGVGMFLVLSGRGGRRESQVEI